MKARFILPLFIALAACSSIGQQDSSDGKDALCSEAILTTEELVSKAKRGVVTIALPEGNGTGFVVQHKDNKTVLLTNNHVVSGVENAKVLWSDGTEDFANVILNGNEDSVLSDIALLEVVGVEGIPLSIASVLPNIGSDQLLLVLRLDSSSL